MNPIFNLEKESTMQSNQPWHQSEAFPETTSRYAFLSSEDIIRAFESKGLVLFKTGAVKARKYHGYQKHVLQFSVPGTLAGDSHPLIIVRNSHHGQGSCILQFGFYRFVCANGLVVGTTELEQRIRHIGDAVEQLDVAIVAMLEAFDKAVARRKRMVVTELTPHAAALLATRALALRGLPGTDSNVAALLATRRPEDSGTSLWNIFNTIQENLIRANFDVEISTINSKGTPEVRKLRAVKSPAADAEINSRLWRLAEEAA